MTKLTGVAPVLLVTDVVAAANYWRDCVGFTYDRLWGDPPCFAIVKRDGMQVCLSQVSNPADIRPYWKIVDQMSNAYFWVDDADSLYEELQRSGAKIDYTLQNKPYGIREFGIQDLDGHDIAFGQPID